MASVQRSDPGQDHPKGPTTAAPPVKAAAADDGFFGAFRKGIGQPIKMPTMSGFSIPIPSTNASPQPEAPKPQPAPSEPAKGRPVASDESRRLQQAIDEKEVAQAEISRLSAQMAELLAERQRSLDMASRVPTLEAELDRVRSELTKTRDRVEYKRIEANEIETAKMKESAQSLRNEVAALSRDLQSGREEISTLTATVSRLQAEIAELQREAVELNLKRTAAEQAAETATGKAANLAAEITVLASARDEALSKLAMSREAVALEARRDRERWQAKAAEKEKQFFLELDSVVAERNSWRAKADSLQIALDKALKKISTADDSTRWGLERARLEAELQRKTASLQDAMNALQSRDVNKKATAVVMIEAQHRVPELSAADLKLIEQNVAFQALAQSLMESVRDRDTVIAQLRFDNTALTSKVADLNSSTAPKHSR